MTRPTLVTFVIVAVFAALAPAQLTPTRLYYGAHRAVPMTVAAPADVQGELRIELFAPAPPMPPGTAPAPRPEALASAAVVPGVIDVATHLPSLWATEQPRLLYAQLSAGGRPIGPPVVLEPMLTPRTAMLVDPATLAPVADAAGGILMFDDEHAQRLEKSGRKPKVRAAAYSGIRAYVDKHVVLDTTVGPIEFRLRPDQAPNTAWNFRQLVEGGFYTDVIFHRVVPTSNVGAPFVIQTGDPNGTGDGGPGYDIDLEPSHLPHDFGVLSMAREEDPNTNGSQVFVALSREATARLDGRYTAFGQAVRGADAILAIERVELLPEPAPQPGEPTPFPLNRPKAPPLIRSAYLVDAPPFGQAPPPVTRPDPAINR